MGANTHGAETVEGGDAEGGGEVAVGAAAGGGFFEGKAHFRSQASGDSEEAARAGGAFHGWTVEAAGDFDAAALVDGPKGAEFSVERGGVSGAGDADIDFGLSEGGDDVGARAAGDDTGVDREAALQVGEALDAGDLAGEFEDRARAGFKVDTGVGGAAVDGDGVVADALAGGFEAPVEAGAGLEDEDGEALFRGFLSEGARCLAAYLFVGIELEDDSPGDGNVEIDEGLHGEEEKGDAGFHVEDARSPETSFGVPEGHGGEGAERPDGVGVAEGKDLAFFLPAGEDELAAEMAAEAATGEGFDFCAAFEFRGEQVHPAVHGGGVVTGRFAFDQFANQGDGIGLILFRVTKIGMHPLL